MAGKAVDKAGDFASTKLLASNRDALNETLGRFFGDVFIYLDSRGDAGNPGKIPALILKAYDDAIAAAPTEPFVIIGHSLGGVISMDVLSHFRPNLQVDLFVTVGSQVAHFEELKLYRASDRGITAPNKAKTPPNIQRWINVFDEVDIFSYSVDRVFDRVNVDAPYDTQTYTIKAHGAYFDQDRFYQRLRKRIDELEN
jgi:pimeloyl-ACP methyl ester carboxylesterase